MAKSTCLKYRLEIASSLRILLKKPYVEDVWKYLSHYYAEHLRAVSHEPLYLISLEINKTPNQALYDIDSGPTLYQETVRLVTVSTQLTLLSTYRQVSNVRRTKSQHLKDSCTVLRLSLPNPLTPDVKSRMKM